MGSGGVGFWGQERGQDQRPGLACPDPLSGLVGSRLDCGARPDGGAVVKASDSQLWFAG